MKLGILGPGRIARTVAATLVQMPEIECYAVASRNRERAEEFARDFGFERVYGSYEDMLQDPELELVYITTPHSHHYEQMLCCLEHGKHVICEKAFTLNADQAGQIRDLAARKGLFVAEAIWTRYMPSRKLIDDIIASGVIGKVNTLTANLSYNIAYKERIMEPALAGGALLDLGMYVLNFASMVFGDDIASMESHVQMIPTGVDKTENITIRYKNGRTAMLMASFACDSDRRCVVYGTKGWLTVDNVNNPGMIEVFHRPDWNHPTMHIDVPKQITGYEYEVEACLRDIPQGKLEPEEMPHSEVLTIMRQMDALRAQWGMKYPFE